MEVSKIDHILGYKTSVNKHKKIEITSYILSDHNGIKVEINSKRNYKKIFKYTKTEQLTFDSTGI
jgi:hypothetical protein